MSSSSSSARLNIDANVWGGSLWKTLHCIAAGCPDQPSAAQQLEYYHLLHSLITTLPCGECREHYAAYWKRQSLPKTGWSGALLRQWITELHNHVNQLTADPDNEQPAEHWTLEQSDAMYYAPHRISNHTRPAPVAAVAAEPEPQPEPQPRVPVSRARASSSAAARRSALAWQQRVWQQNSLSMGRLGNSRKILPSLPPPPPPAAARLRSVSAVPNASASTGTTSSWMSDRNTVVAAAAAIAAKPKKKKCGCSRRV